MNVSPLIAFRPTTDPAFTHVGTAVTNERYVLEVVADPPAVTVVYCSERGKQWGTVHAERLISAGGLADAMIDEHPRFAARGIVESFYGRPWSHDQRLDMVRFLGAHRMNTFAYSPKDDPYCRRRWSEPYPAAALAPLNELVTEARRHAVAISYGLAPGLSIRYCDPNDVERLTAKYLQVAGLGVRQFLLLLDDIPAALQHPGDRAAYPDLVSAHVTLINRLRQRFDEVDPGLHLAVCPTLYHGRGDEPYLAELGAGTDPRIDLLWTGRATWSPELNLADAATFMRTTSRPVVYWDNYPANDLHMSGELHLGAYRGRDPQLYRFSRGILAEPMGQAECSKIALATIADYLWDPEGYDPDRSWDAAILEVAGARDADAVRLFADNVRTSCLEEADSPLLASALARLEFETQLGDATARRASLAELALRFAKAAAQLLGPDVDNPVLAAEMRPWLEVFDAGAHQLLGLLDGLPPSNAKTQCPRPPMVFGDVLDMASPMTSLGDR